MIGSRMQPEAIIWIIDWLMKYFQMDAITIIEVNSNTLPN